MGTSWTVVICAFVIGIAVIIPAYRARKRDGENHKRNHQNRDAE